MKNLKYLQVYESFIKNRVNESVGSGVEFTTKNITAKYKYVISKYGYKLLSKDADDLIKFDAISSDKSELNIDGALLKKIENNDIADNKVLYVKISDLSKYFGIQNILKVFPKWKSTDEDIEIYTYLDQNPEIELNIEYTINLDYKCMYFYGSERNTFEDENVVLYFDPANNYNHVLNTEYSYIKINDLIYKAGNNNDIDSTLYSFAPSFYATPEFIKWFNETFPNKGLDNQNI